MTRAFALGLILGVLVNQRWVRRIRRTLAADDAADWPDGMCPNCVTPWKCNGPHLDFSAPMSVTYTPPLSGTVTEYDGTSWTWTA